MSARRWGYGIGQGSVLIINRLRLEYEGLYPVLTLTLALLTYGTTASLGGNGFLAVYLAGLILGNSSFIHKKSLARFHDGLAWLMQIVMFLTLGLLVFPSRLIAVIPAGLRGRSVSDARRPTAERADRPVSGAAEPARKKHGRRGSGCAARRRSSWRPSRWSKVCPKRIQSFTWCFSSC